MGLRDLSWNISGSRLVIPAALVFEISCGKQTDGDKKLPPSRDCHWRCKLSLFEHSIIIIIIITEVIFIAL